ncbi:MAG: hypothetical protein RLZZ453_401 [Chlamydiota bacterium]|jgi:MFS family permease
MTEDIRRTKFSLLWMNLAAEPLVALYTLIPFLLRKEFGSSMFQISLFLTLRPVLSLFSFYWSAYVKERKGHLVWNYVSASVLAYLPFLFFPWAGGFWFLLLASGLYQLFSKAAIPSLIEVLKRKLPKSVREKTFSLLFVLSFVESGILGLLFGGLLDTKSVGWSTLFCAGGLLGLTGLLFFSSLKVPVMQEEKPPLTHWTKPWKESFQLMRDNPSFAYFQKIFMFGGSALMLILPATSAYYADILQLSYTNVVTARFVFMAVGIALSSFLWAKGLSQVPILKLTVGVLCGFGLFPLCLLGTLWNPSFLYLAFFLYGVAQAGSHLIWNLSGTLFAGGENSLPYTRANLLMHALRGAVVPLIGGFLCDLTSPIVVLALGATLCLYGAKVLWQKLPVQELPHPRS